jgi:hypothetical protein
MSKFAIEPYDSRLEPDRDQQERHMATQPTHSGTLAPPAPAHTASALERGLGIVDRWQDRRAERKKAQLISERNRRVLAKWLRGIANHRLDPDPIRRRHEVLLHYRAASVRTDLLEIAALIEHVDTPDPDCVAALRNLLTNGAGPLYHPGVHVSELYATLDYVRSRL